MRSFYRFLVFVMVMGLGTAVWARSDGSEHAAPAASHNEAAIERIFLQEAKLVETMHSYTPMVETYIQRFKPDNELGTLPDKDRYFLGRLVLGQKKLQDQAFNDNNKLPFMSRVLDRLDGFYRINYANVRFMQTVFLNQAFDKDHYDLKYQRQQFLGEVRTLVFDVTPRAHGDETRFKGRIWVEDQD